MVRGTTAARAAGRLLLSELLLLGLLVVAEASAQTASVYLERNPIRIDETVRLVLEIDAEADDRDLDLGPLGADFVVLGTSSSRNVNIVNGRRSTVTRWWVELEPRREGLLKIPALALGAVSTEPIALSVLPADAAAPARRGVVLRGEFEPVNAYVDGQLTYVLRLELGVSISNGSLSEPDIPGAVVERLGEDSSFEERREGRRWRVIERRYAVFPQAAGELVVAPVRFSGRVAAGFSNDLFGSTGFGNSRILRARTDEVRIEVEPPQYRDSTWLPARELRLTESFSADPATLRVGEPLTRTLSIEALGLRGEQLPPVEPPAPAGVRIYPDQAQTRTGSDRDRVVGIREERMAIVPTAPGELVLPAIRIPWWDVEQQIQRVAEIPARRVAVLPAVSDIPSAPSETPGPRPVGVDPDAAPGPGPRPGWRDYAAIGFAGLWLVTLVAWWRARRVRVAPGKRPAPDPQLPLRRTALKRACLSGDAAATNQALAAWAERRWQGDAPSSLAQLAARLDDAALTTALGALDRALYAQEAGDWDGASLWRALDSIPAPHRHRSAPRDTLAPLHPGRTSPDIAPLSGG